MGDINSISRGNALALNIQSWTSKQGRTIEESQNRLALGCYQPSPEV